jgi:aminoglycoside 3-N-acetyltransferase I
MQIKRLDKNEIEDFRDLIEIFKIVLENDIQIPNNQHLSKLLSMPDFMVFVVKINNKVVDGLTIYVLHQYYSEKSLAYIYDVGIAPDFQRKGLGKALIAEVCNFCKANGFDDAYVEAEDEDIEAVNFYRKTNFNSELIARHFTYTFTDAT